MTTIAANHEMMAVDTLTTDGGGTVVSVDTKKMKRLRGDLVACSGDSDEAVEFEQWYEAGCNKEDRPSFDVDRDFGALVLTSGGELFVYYNRCFPVPVNAEYRAMGSGDDIAMGAMAMGASPERAVEVACDLDSSTGGRVIVEYLKPKRTIKDPAQPPVNVTVEQAREAARTVRERREQSGD